MSQNVVVKFDMVAVRARFALGDTRNATWQSAGRVVSCAPPTELPVVTERSVPRSDHGAFHERGVPGGQLTSRDGEQCRAANDVATKDGADAHRNVWTTATALLCSFVAESGSRRRHALHV
jgi:Zn-dependent M28 family amino/carboxypeptidase